MDHAFAAYLIGAMCLLSDDVNQPLLKELPALSDEELRLLRKRITDIWGSAYFEFIAPLEKIFPDLNPNKPKLLRHECTPHAAAEGTPEALTRVQLGQALIEAASAADTRLLDILGKIEENLPPSDRETYFAAAICVQRDVEALRQYGHVLAEG
jgi:hypothetical protein